MTDKMLSEITRLRKAIEHAPCPWSTCCRAAKHPGRDGTLAWRRCWKAQALARPGDPDDPA